jgi:murein DD-endopeptidase MepM/ murein hydrolase activator NlpD
MRRRKSGKSIVVSLIFISLIAGIIYLAQSPYFERKAPELVSAETIYWNRKDPLEVTIRDNVGIKHYSVSLHDGEKIVATKVKTLEKTTAQTVVEIQYPKLGFNYNKTDFTLKVEAVDTSFWDFFAGNKLEKEIQIVVDYKQPTVAVLSNSYSITKGGSALVVFKAFDENLVDLKIETSYGKVFEIKPFYKPNHYVALLAWPVQEESFSAHIVAKDVANNVTKRRIPYYLNSKRYRVSNIKVSDSFIDNKITELARRYAEFDAIGGGTELFKAVNETLRNQNVALIEKVSTINDFEMINDWDIKPFYPLKNGAVQAGFGDHRIYSYNGQNFSESYHLGIDYASVQNAAITMSNPGVVKYAGFNGLYGNMPVVDHGLGLHSLYGHCSGVYVQEGENVSVGQRIADTGATGLAFGDHLHFGISIQGIEVRPEEWMDSNWIKLNIRDIINKAKEMIDIQER